LKEIELKSRSGKPRLRGLMEEDMASMLDDLALMPSLTPDTIGSIETLENNTEVIIGEGRDAKYPLILSHPLFVDSSQFSKVNKSVRIALAYGASIAKTPINIGEGILPEEKRIAKKFEGDLILQWSPIRIGIDTKTVGKGRAVVIDLSDAHRKNMYSLNELPDRVQGKGGLVCGDAFGPKGHLDVETSKDIKKHVELLKEATGYNLPILIKIPPGEVYENTKAALQADADAVIIDTSLDPFSTPSSIKGTLGRSLLGSIPPVLKAFKTTKAQKKGIKLLVSGGFRDGADILKLLALGADAVGMVESAAIAIGCDLCGECHVGKCKKGIATRNQKIKPNFDWKIAGKRLANYIRATKKEIELLMNFIGVKDVKDIDNKHIKALTYDAAAITGVKLAGYDRELPMWFH
jgi:glutamate synthase domain-containing protein 2